jgi:hypothetical protein
MRLPVEQSTGSGRIARVAQVVLAAIVLMALPATAGTRLYNLEIPAGRAVTYEIPLPVDHPGALSVEAEWSGQRRISLRVDRPGAMVAVARRAGPSPLAMEIEVLPEMAGGGEWKLTIYSVTGRSGGSGRLTIQLPEAEVEDSDSRAARPVTPAPRPDPWMLPRRAPAGSAPDRVQLHESAERLRALIQQARADRVADHCRWQTGLMRFLADSRDAITDEEVLPSASTRRILVQMADSIRLVQGLRTSTDPLLAGPAPGDPGQREVWEALRRERIEVLESTLDETLEAIQRGHASVLDDYTWPVRMVTCLAACERHFEERVRVGEEQAINRDLADAQWPTLLAAADALDALADVRPAR